jgi:dienelactone hydrolase
LEALDFLNYAKANYRVDLSRIYISGLSMGGMIATDLGAGYASQIAAITPIAGVYFEGVPVKSQKIANGRLPVWAFHNKIDPQVTLDIPLYFISEINKNNPVIPPKLTIFNVFGHDAWDEALDPNYRENGMNMYEWMLQYSR